MLHFYDILCFQVNHMSFGELKTVDLIPDGSKIRVTKQSAHDYVQAYMRYTYHDSVKNQFEAFQRGFMKVCNGRVIVSECVCEGVSECVLCVCVCVHVYVYLPV